MNGWSPQIILSQEACNLSPCNPHQFFLREWLGDGLNKWISNIEAERLLLLVDDDTWIPLTVNREEWDNAYTCSRLSALVGYPRLELQRNIAGATGKIFEPVLNVSDRLLRGTTFNRVVQINNWCYPTQSIPKLEPQQWLKIFEVLAERFPKHTLLLRGLNEVQHPDLLQVFSDLGLSRQVARQIYIFDPSDLELEKKRMLKSDLKLRPQPGLRLVDHHEFTPADLKRSAELYERLYIKKHGPLNPQFTADYVILCHTTRHLEFFGFRDEATDNIVAVMGILRDWTTDYVHFIGTELEENGSAPLYRYLFAELIRRTVHRGRMLNYSSGSAHFKRLRGAQPVLEYWAIYDAHTPLKARIMNSAIRAVANNVAGPALQYFKL